MNNVRPIRVIKNYLKYPQGSCVFQMGETKVLCTASISDDLPDHAKASGKGWVTAEYSMLPGSTLERVSRGKVATAGRTKEIQRLIGRSLRAGVNMTAIPELGITLDCDVLQADGGTRTASINGSFIALVQGLRRYKKEGRLSQWPITDYVAAVSVGLIEGKVVVDLDYTHDVKADVDMNVVMTGSGRFVEIQGCAERQTFSRAELDKLLEAARRGIQSILRKQKEVLGSIDR